MCLSPDGPQHFHLLTRVHSACAAAIDHFSGARLGAQPWEGKDGEWGGASHPAPMAPWSPVGYNRSSELQGLGVLESSRVGVRRDSVALSLEFLLSA